MAVLLGVLLPGRRAIITLPLTAATVCTHPCLRLISICSMRKNVYYKLKFEIFLIMHGILVEISIESFGLGTFPISL